MTQTHNSSIKMQIRTSQGIYICPLCYSTLQKSGMTKNGRYNRFLCQNKSCNKQWVELSPAKPAVLRGHIPIYDEK